MFWRHSFLLFVIVAACGSRDPSVSETLTAPAATAASASIDGGPVSPDSDPPSEDRDADGLADALEAKIAAEYMPFLSVHPDDGCKTHGMLFRLAPHPKETGRLMMWVDVLYDRDCGASDHPGDDEMFGVVIDPARPAPAGILALRAISHQGTPCERVSTCGQCTGMSACSTATRNGASYPALYASKDKHGNYADTDTCRKNFICDFGGCALAKEPDGAPILNAGEPGHALVHDLTTEGFVTAANGWTQSELLHFDPWKAGDFGSAGDVSKDLVDPAFVIDTTACK
jgi:hypothetical protein